MRALALTRLGGPQALAVLDVPEPPLPGEGQVRIRVRAAALNHLDLFLTEGVKGITLSFPHIVGTDGAGEIDAVGPGVNGFSVGDRVAINPGISCGQCEVCRAGEEPYCREFQILGEHRPGTCAELLNVPERNIARIPADMPWPVAAAFPLANLTAWRMLVTRAKLTGGETVLIWGAGGGISLAALQIAVELGARVIVTGSTDPKLENALTMGAAIVFNHRDETPDAIVRKIRQTLGGGVHVVVDTVGEKTWDASLKALVPGGRLVTCGATTGPVVSLDIRRLFWFQWSVLGSTMGTRAEFRRVVELVHQKKLWPVVDSVVPLAEGRLAYERMARGEQIGKLVIEVSP